MYQVAISFGAHDQLINSATGGTKVPPVAINPCIRKSAPHVSKFVTSPHLQATIITVDYSLNRGGLLGVWLHAKDVQ